MLFRSDIASIQTALENKVVAQRLADYGLTPQELRPPFDHNFKEFPCRNRIFSSV